MTKCPQCGVDFTPVKSHRDPNRNTIYCSAGCVRGAFKAMVRRQRGPLHPRWTSDGVSYDAAHRRVHIARGSAVCCDQCGSSDGPPGLYQWANLTGNYEDVNDYRQMCIPCHVDYDQSTRRRKLGACRKGHQLTPENIIATKSGSGRRCRICHDRGAREWKLKNSVRVSSYMREYRARKGAE